MFAKAATDQFLRSLDRIERGRLDLTTPDGRVRTFQGAQSGAAASLHIHDWRVPGRLASKGDAGFAHDYKDGHWDTDNLQNLITLALENEHAVKDYVFGGRIAQTLGNLSYHLKLNTLRGSRRNIHAHYDLGNRFYGLWLDPSMTYSSALYASEGESLQQAQHNKYDRIVDRLQGNGGSVLEIGCGWGGFAERATQRGDFGVKGITLSTEQHDYARDRLGGNATVALEDYRAQTGTFDNIVSIEMFEAVGEKYWPTYFGKLGALLKQGGKAVVQTITIEDKRFDRYRRGSDFIRSFIFPGGMLPSPSRFGQEAAKAGLRVTDRFEFGQDYARTLEQWLHNFDAKTAAVKQLGFDDGFIKLWRFYLASCIAGFRTGRTGVMQVEMQHA